MSVKNASAGGEPAEAFAKGGDSEEHLGGVLCSVSALMIVYKAICVYRQMSWNICDILHKVRALAKNFLMISIPSSMVV